MKKQYLILSLIVFAFLAGCQKESENTINPMQNNETEALKSGAEDPCHEESFTIYGGQTIPVGTLNVSNDEDEIFVTYDLTGTDWYLEETHLYVGPEEDLPLNGGGNPKIGHFPYSSTHSGVQTYTYTLDRSDFTDCFTVAAHAVVVQMDENGNQTAEETAWADGGTEFPGKRWGWYVQEYCSQDCACNEAFAYGSKSTCFTAYGFTNDYGWNVGSFPGNLSEGYCKYQDLYLCPTSCDPNSDDIVGAVRIKDIVDGDKIGVEFSQIKEGYTLKETYVYIGTDPLPMVNGGYSIDPQDYTYINTNVTGNYDEAVFNNFNENFYVIAYAVIEEN